MDKGCGKPVLKLETPTPSKSTTRDICATTVRLRTSSSDKFRRGVGIAMESADEDSELERCRMEERGGVRKSVSRWSSTTVARESEASGRGRGSGGLPLAAARRRQSPSSISEVVVVVVGVAGITLGGAGVGDVGGNKFSSSLSVVIAVTTVTDVTGTEALIWW